MPLSETVIPVPKAPRTWTFSTREVAQSSTPLFAELNTTPFRTALPKGQPIPRSMAFADPNPEQKVPLPAFHVQPEAAPVIVIPPRSRVVSEDRKSRGVPGKTSRLNGAGLVDLQHAV